MTPLIEDCSLYPPELDRRENSKPNKENLSSKTYQTVVESHCAQQRCPDNLERFVGLILLRIWRLPRQANSLRRGSSTTKRSRGGSLKEDAIAQ